MKRKNLSYAEVNANMTQHEIQAHLNTFVELAVERFEQKWPGTVSITGAPQLKTWSLRPDHPRPRNDPNWSFELVFHFGLVEPIIVKVLVEYLMIFRQENADLDYVIYTLRKPLGNE